jgi:hypothetical protein
MDSTESVAARQKKISVAITAAYNKQVRQIKNHAKNAGDPISPFAAPGTSHKRLTKIGKYT